MSLYIVIFERPAPNRVQYVRVSCIILLYQRSLSLTWLNIIFVTWLSERIHIFRRFAVSVWHDMTYLCVWLDCHNASTCDMTRSDLYPAIATMPFKSVRLSKRKSQLAEFSVCLVINSVILLHLLLRKDNALRPFPGPLYAYNRYVSRVRKLQFLVEKMQCVHVGNDLFYEHACHTHTHVRCVCKKKRQASNLSFYFPNVWYPTAHKQFLLRTQTQKLWCKYKTAQY